MMNKKQPITHPLAELGGVVINCSLSIKTIYKLKNIDIYWLFRKYSQSIILLVIDFMLLVLQADIGTTSRRILVEYTIS